MDVRFLASQSRITFGIPTRKVGGFFALGLGRAGQEPPTRKGEATATRQSCRVFSSNWVEGLKGGLSLFSSSDKPDLSMKWWDDSDVAVVTGGNKGIGYEICKQLVEKDFYTVLTARDEKRGKEAVRKLREETGKDEKVDFFPLDITDAGSIDAFRQYMAGKYPQGVTALVNNAGFAYKGNAFGAEEARVTLDTNYSGTANLCEAMVPFMKDGQGRVVTVGSFVGRTSIVSKDLLARLQAAKTPEALSSLVDEFVEGIRTDTYKQKGWPGSMYGVSKLALHLYSRLLAERLRERRVSVNVVCPGWCRTDMSSGRGTKSAAQGADTPVWLATLPPDEIQTDSFFQERKKKSF
jgi:carbonyl reductase 1